MAGKVCGWWFLFLLLWWQLNSCSLSDILSPGVQTEKGMMKTRLWYNDFSRTYGLWQGYNWRGSSSQSPIGIGNHPECYGNLDTQLHQEGNKGEFCPVSSVCDVAGHQEVMTFCVYAWGQGTVTLMFLWSKCHFTFPSLSQAVAVSVPGNNSLKQTAH